MSTRIQVQAALSTGCLRPGRHVQASQAQHRCWSSSPPQWKALTLAYDVYEPPTRASSSSSPGPDEPGPIRPSDVPVILLHGLFGSKRNHRSISKVLAQDLKRPVFALDLRNHGDSPQDPRHDYQAMADDLDLFIREHGAGTGTRRATLIGHSMGAKAAMTLALRSPELVDSLVAVDNAPVDAALSGDFAKYIQGMRKVEESRVSKQKETDDILKDYEPSAAIRAYLLTNLFRPKAPPPPLSPPPPPSQSAEQQHLRFRIPLDILAASLDHVADFPYKDPDAITPYKKPALFVRGSRSRYVPDEVLPVVGRFFPMFTVVDVEAGHWVVSENPRAFRDAVVDFMLENQEKDG